MAKSHFTRRRCFCLAVLGLWTVLCVVTDEPFGLPVTSECKGIDDSFFSDPDLKEDNKASVLRNCALVCFPIDFTVMVYKDGTTSTEMDFKQGLTFSEFISENIYQNKEALNSIKSKLDVLQQYKKCAVIGNSGILTGSGCGREIDHDYDFVIRSNIAPIKNFRNDVGTKTNLTVLNYDIIRTLYSVLSGDNALEKARFIERLQWLNDSIVWYHKGARTRFWAKNKLRYLANELKMSYHLPIRIAYTYAPIEYLTKRFWSIDVPYTTTGLDVYSVALTFCQDITLYGFYPFNVDSRGRSIRHHYYDDSIVDYDYNRIHNIPKEFRLLQRLDDMGILKLKTTPCQ